MPKYAVAVRACQMRTEIEAENATVAAEIAAEMFHDGYVLDEIDVQTAQEPAD